MTGPDELTTKEALALAGVSDRSLRAWTKAGLVVSRRTGDGVRIDRASLVAHLRKRAESAPLPFPEAAAAPRHLPDPPPDLLRELLVLLREELAATRKERADAEREREMMAGRIGWLERQIQERDARILQLEAGPVADPDPNPEAVVPPVVDPEALPPWWARLRRWWERGGY